jgi:ABC-type nitrate/sulfonate/bicarbonate transport system permease component
MAGAFLLVGLAWQFAKRQGWLPISVPAPTEVWDAFASDPGTLWYHVWPTVVAAACGYAIAGGVAIGCASLAVVLPGTAPTIYNVAVVIYSIPLIALSPVLVTWMGTGAAVRITIAALAGFFPVLVGAIQGFRAVDRRAAELFRVLSARWWQRLLYLSVPSALPYLFSGLKVSAASAVLGAIVSEWAGAERGLGVMMAYALFSFDVPKVWLSLVTSAALAMLSYAAVAVVERGAVRWDAVAAESTP